MKSGSAAAVLFGLVASSAAAAGLAEPISDRPGNPVAGRAAFVDRASGHCLLCHRVAGLDEPFQGNLGPDLSDFGRRMDLALTRLRLVDATRLNPQTVMPAYYRSEGLTQVAPEYRGRPVLSAQQIEDILAFLATLKTE